MGGGGGILKYYNFRKKVTFIRRPGNEVLRQKKCHTGASLERARTAAE